MAKLRKRLASAAQNARKHVLSLALVQNLHPSPAPRQPSHPRQSSSAAPKTVVVRARKLGDAPSTRALREKQSNIHKMGRQRSPPTKRSCETDDAARYVNLHRREVGRFGAQGLDTKKARAYEADDLVRLGCKPAKRTKEPIAMLQRRRANEKRREAAQRHADLESGMFVRTKRKKFSQK